MAVAIVIILLVIGSLVFHFVSPWWFTPLASNWSAIDNTINVTFWVTGIVFVLVNCFLAYVIFRYRFKRHRRADYEPENKKLEGWLIGVTTIGVAAMLAPGLVVWSRFVSVPEQATVVEVMGQQWQWRFRLPGDDGKLGRAAVKFIDHRNPFGLDPADPNAQDDILIDSNELHLALDQPVNVVLRSQDVLHNFAIPQFRVKMDLVPGLSSSLWFTPTRIGRFDLLCEELCGMAHYSMRGHVVVDSPADYELWVSAQPTFRQQLAQQEGNIERGRTLYSSCAVCHGQNGQGDKNFQAPQLAGQATWYVERQLRYFKTAVRGAHSKDIYGQQMAAMSGALVDDTAVRDVASYIHSLTPTVADEVPDGDRVKGQKLFQNCAFCHGDKAQGNFALNAPRLAGQHAWYLQRQLEYYQQDVRGTHPQDKYGNQMILMSKLLQNKQAVADVAAYLSALGGAD